MNQRRRWVPILLLYSMTAPNVAARDQRPESAGSARLNLPVSGVVERYPPYADFCRRVPTECELHGAAVLPFSGQLLRTLHATNAAVNEQIVFALDTQLYDEEEHWALPHTGRGDCEDMALEKRARLARQGLPRAAMRLALVFLRAQLSSHCVLTVETTEGTFLLDSFSDDVLRWDHTPYNFEARERPDGYWERFDQTHWRYSP